MAPPDFSVLTAFNTAVWLITLTIPAIAMIGGFGVGAAVLMWIMRALRDVFQNAL